MKRLQIDEQRIIKDLGELRGLGLRDGAIHRPFGSLGETAARRWLTAKLDQAGIAHKTDGATNLIARLGPAQGPAVATGSHLDSVPGGGPLDGGLGVLAGLEALRCLKEAKVDLNRGVELIAFADEEGRFGGMLGSEAMTGGITAETLSSALDQDGIRLTDILQAHDRTVEDVLAAARPADDFDSFFELHIEQGPVLEREGVSLGVVEAISGLSRYTVHLEGRGGHAGTLPIEDRRDAMTGVAAISLALESYARITGVLATIGTVTLRPGAPNVVPWGAEFTVDVRAFAKGAFDEAIRVMEEIVRETARERGLQSSWREESRFPPTPCAGDLQRLLQETARDHGENWIKIASGAAHDTQNMAKRTRAALLFVPSLGGLSHHPDEDTNTPDILSGIRVLANAIYRQAS